MYNFINYYNFYINNLKILIFISNFNKFYNNIFLNNFIKKIFYLGIYKKNLLIFSIIGSFEFSYFFYNLCFFDFFDFYLIVGFILKNKTFHYEIISLNINFFLCKISLFFNIPFINFLILSNNKNNFLYKIFCFFNLNLKIFLKFLNFLYFLNF